MRTGVLVFGLLTAALGAYLCLSGGKTPGIQLLLSGALILCGVLFERWRYHNRNASQAGDWQRTGERFVDPTSGEPVEVLYDPQSGERRYSPLSGTDRNDAD